MIEGTNLTDRHFSIDLFAECARKDLAELCARHIETSNRSFGQMIRQHRERMERVMMDDEMMGDL
jgi:hypothetical protein